MQGFNPATACQYAEAIAYPRAVGTQGETTARAKIAGLLEGMGMRVEHQPVAFSTGFGTFLSIEIFTSQILILAALGLPVIHPDLVLIPVFLLVLLIALTGPLNRWVQAHSFAPRPGETPSLWSRLCYSLGTHFATANILAKLPDSQDDPAVPHLFLVAHSDSKSQRISLGMRMALFAISISGGLLFAGLTFLGLIFPWFTTISHYVAVVVLSASLPLLFLDFGNASPGAIDDASGVGLVLHLAEVLAAQPHIRERFSITVLISGAEELATMGVLAYVKDGGVALRKQAGTGGLHVLNFDGIGVHGDLYLVAPRRRAVPEKHPSLPDAIRDSCAQLGLKLGGFNLPGALFDHIPFAEAGFDAVSLITIGKASRYIHSPGDSADKLDPRGFDQAGRVALKVIEQLSEAYALYDLGQKPTDFTS
jgi:hypothetical protein